MMYPKMSIVPRRITIRIAHRATPKRRTFGPHADRKAGIVPVSPIPSEKEEIT
jgi:hypothetical protein